MQADDTLFPNSACSPERAEEAAADESAFWAKVPRLTREEKVAAQTAACVLLIRRNVATSGSAYWAISVRGNSKQLTLISRAAEAIKVFLGREQRNAPGYVLNCERDGNGLRDPSGETGKPASDAGSVATTDSQIEDGDYAPDGAGEC